ncbi:MAG: hypothetical protein AAF333_01295 [Planctomycetota bacterium]
MTFSPRPSRPARAFTLVETALATVLVGGLFVVAMNMVGASRVTQSRYAERDQALLLAEDLLQEVLTRPYEDPGDPDGVVFGIELDETLTVRASLDDADDYHAYSESPPADVEGNAIPGAAGFTRAVQVQWVELDDPKTVASAETGLKRVTVAVSKGGRPTVILRAYLTSAWPAADEMIGSTP